MCFLQKQSGNTFRSVPLMQWLQERALGWKNAQKQQKTPMMLTCMANAVMVCNVIVKTPLMRTCACTYTNAALLSIFENSELRAKN